MSGTLSGYQTAFNTVNEEYNKLMAAYYDSTADETTVQELFDAADDYYYEHWLGAYDALE
jgi:hypothetical protein